MAEEISGHWSGLMMDGEGHRARLDLDLEQSDGALKGSLTFALVEDHEVSERCGEASGKISDGTVHLRYAVPSEAGGVEVDFEGDIMPVKHHAIAALCGCYRVRGAGDESLSGGVAILWKYRTSK